MSSAAPATREVGDERPHLRADRRGVPGGLLAVDEVDDLAGAPGDLEAMRHPRETPSARSSSCPPLLLGQGVVAVFLVLNIAQLGEVL